MVKAHAVIDFAFSCLTGNTFADTFSVARPLSVAYATGEGVEVWQTGCVQWRSITDGRTSLSISSDIPQLYERTSPPGAVAFISAWRARQRQDRYLRS